jgi:phospholipid/cholesterol/gamma-HCH transport system permease protein
VPSFAQRADVWAESRTSLDCRVTHGDSVLKIALAGDIELEQAPALWKVVTDLLLRAKLPGHVEVDFANVDKMDGACLALIVHFSSELRRRRIRCDLLAAKPELLKLIRLYQRARIRKRPDRRPRSTVEQVGQATANALETARDALGFFGDLLVTLVGLIRQPRGVNLRDITLTMERAGADALPIVLLINFLVGFVMAYQSAPQLREFGANILVADLVGLAMVRELGPLMTGIIVCGRTGAAFAAELGTMKVSEEVDALRTFGLSAMGYLVVPRITGLVLVAPLLTLAADVVGILGGLLVAIFELDLTSQGFFRQITQVIKPKDIVSGLAKSVIFSFAIALIACERGLSTTGGAAEVGRRTTSAVVVILFALIVLDALFTVVLRAFSL